MSVYYINRKIYLTRRTLDNEFEDKRIRIDFINNSDLIINWGSIVKEINYSNYDINNFNISPLTFCISNHDGYFYDESRLSSLWNGYLTRIYSKIEIEAGENEDNLQNIYYGFIDNIKNTYDEKTYITVQPPEYILNRFSIKNLNLHGKINCIDILKEILQERIIELFIENYDIDLGIKNIIIEKSEKLEGTYWEIIKYICLITNSYVYFDNNIIYIIPKTKNAGDTNIILYSQNYNNGGKDNIISIMKYDDEGHKKIRLRFEDNNSDLYSVTKNKKTLNKYLGLTDSIAETESVDLINIQEEDKQNILNKLVDYWSIPKRSIEITTKFNNELKLLKTLKIDIRSENEVTARWGFFHWNTDARWGSLGKGFILNEGTRWVIKSVNHNLNEWKSTINLEEV